MVRQLKQIGISAGVAVLGLLGPVAPQARGDTPAIDVTALQAKAEGGDALAAFQLGTLDYVGASGVVQDWVGAAKWLTLSATAGNADAQCELGLLYEIGSYGDAEPQEPATAVQWYGKSAALGNRYGEFALAAMYDSGKGVTKDPVKAAQLYAAASAQGYTADKTTFPEEQINRHFHQIATDLTGTTE